MPETKRTDRVGQLVQQELARMIVEEIKDPRIGFVTVTEVRVSGDLRTARVFVSIYGSEEQQGETLAGLTAASGYLRRELGNRLRMKYTPDLTFIRDDSLDRAQRIDQIMDAISSGDREIPDETVAPCLDVQTNRSELAERRARFTKEKRSSPRGGTRRKKRR